MVDIPSVKGASTSPTPEEQQIKNFVGKMYEKQSVILDPKGQGKLKTAVEVLFKNPEAGKLIPIFTGPTYTKIRLKDHAEPLYVKIDDLGKALGLTAGEIKILKKEGPKAIEKLAIEAAEGLGDSLQALEQKSKTEEKLIAITKKLGSGEFSLALESLHKKKLITEDRALAIIYDSDFDDPAMQRTIIDIGDKLTKYGKLVKGYVRSKRGAALRDNNGKWLYEKKTYAYNVNKQGDIDIHTRLLGQGAFTKAKLSRKLQTGEKEAVLTIKEKQDEFEAVQMNLKTVKDKKIINTPSIHKYSYEVKSKGGQAKYVLGQELYCGSGVNLIKLPIKHALNVLRDVAEGYAALHAESLVHSDIKPDNISLKGDLNNNDQALHGILNDFGLMSPQGQFKGGTLEYLSPEIAMACIKYNSGVGNAHVELAKATTDKYDCFSFGVTIFEIVTSKNTMENGKPFSSAEKDSEIAIEIAREIKKINDKIDDKSTTEEKDDALIRMNLLKVAEKLLIIDPVKRMKTKVAAQMLADQCEVMGLQRQKIS